MPLRMMQVAMAANRIKIINFFIERGSGWAFGSGDLLLLIIINMQSSGVKFYLNDQTCVF